MIQLLNHQLSYLPAASLKLQLDQLTLNELKILNVLKIPLTFGNSDFDVCLQLGSHAVHHAVQL